MMRGLLTKKPKVEVVIDDPRERRVKLDITDPVRRSWKPVDVSKLSLDECQELRDLHRRASRVENFPYPVQGLGALSEPERKRTLELLEKGMPDAERERLRRVEGRREQRELERFAAAILSEGVPPRLRPGLHPGEALLPRAAFEIGTLHVGDLGVLALVLHAFSSGNAGVFRGGRFAEDGDALVLPRKVDLAVREWNVDYRQDGMASSVVDLVRTLEHLSRNDLIDLERDAGSWVVRLGPRMGSS
jgi:hypothetical protein